MLHFVNLSPYYILIIAYFVTDGGAQNYVAIPELLKYQLQIEKVEYDYNANATFEIKQEKIGNEVLYSCKIGGHKNGKFHDCFPYPPSGAILKYKSKEYARKMCEKFVKLHIVYWVQDRVVWCDLVLVSTENVHFRMVENVIHSRYGAIIYYHRRSNPIYKVVPLTGKGTGKFTCKIGVYVRNKGVQEMVQCFPFPSVAAIRRKLTKDDKETVENDCQKFVQNIYAYFFDDRLVWCDKLKFESLPVPYRRGVYVLKVKPGLQQIYPNEVYYDLTAPAVHIMSSTRTRDLVNYLTCKIGAFLKDKEFHECFPEPKFYKIPKGENSSEVEKKCQELAKNYMTYWEGKRLVWCEEKEMKIVVSTNHSSPTMMKYISVPSVQYNRHGKIILYQERTNANYQIIHQSVKGDDGVTIKKYSCKFGYIDARNSIMTDCFPDPLNRRWFEYKDDEKTNIQCTKLAQKVFVYWFDGRMVWCNTQKYESNILMYRRGAYILNLTEEFWKYHGDKIYYDQRSDALYQMKHFFQEYDGKTIHHCTIGKNDNKGVFNECFPQPTIFQLPRGENKSRVEERCKSLADKCTMYWEDERLVWCVVNFQSKFKKTRPT